MMTPRLFGATIALVAALGVSSALAATLKVDDDGVQCPGAPYTTLQAAVAAAAAGDKIKVCPGSYGGQVTIQGMVFTGAGETAVRTDPANVKFALKNSVFTLNANGVYFHSAVGSKSAVKGNCFHLQSAAGVRTGYGLRDASIAKNFFFGTTGGAGIVMDQQTATTNDRIKITGNRSEADETFAVILGTVDSSFAKNKVNGNGATFTAVFVGGNNANLAITGNTVTNAGTRGIRFNTQFFPGFPPGGPSTGAIVTKNVIDKAGSHGIAVDSGAGESALVSSTIVKNTVTDSGQSGAGDGIRIVDFMAMGANGGNTVEDNTISGSFNHDCHDTTTGAGTAGTASTWTGNAAATHNVTDLCFTGAANGVAD